MFGGRLDLLRDDRLVIRIGKAMGIGGPEKLGEGISLSRARVYVHACVNKGIGAGAGGANERRHQPFRLPSGSISGAGPGAAGHTGSHRNTLTPLRFI